jgi:hypothetical protein
VFLARVVHAEAREGSPLAYFRGKFAGLSWRRTQQCTQGCAPRCSSAVRVSVAGWLGGQTLDGLVTNGPIERQTPVDHEYLTGYIPGVG